MTPLIKFFGAFVVGLSAGHAINLQPSYLFLFGLILIVLYATVKKCIFKDLFLLFAIINTGFLLYEINQYLLFENNPIRFLYSKVIVLRGKLVCYPKETEKRTYLCIKSEKIRGKIEVIINGTCPKNLEWGDIIEVKGKLSRPLRYEKSRKIVGRIWTNPANIKILKNKRPHLMKALDKLRRFIIFNLYKLLPFVHASFMKGILLGDKSGIPKPIHDLFVDSGIIHVLAVSGLHVGLVAFVGFVTLRALGLSTKTTSLINLLIIFLYAMLTGLRPSVVRASIMASAYLLSFILDRESSSFHNLALAGLLILIFNPLSLSDISFQLSFAATLGILLVLPKTLEILKNLPIWFSGAIGVSLGAQLFVGPFCAYYFQKVSFIALLTNLIVVPLIAVLVWLGFSISIISVLSLSVAKVFAESASLVCEVILNLTYLFGKLPFSAKSISQPPSLFIAIYYTLIVSILYLKPLSLKRLSFVGIGFLNILIWLGLLT